MKLLKFNRSKGFGNTEDVYINPEYVECVRLYEHDSSDDPYRGCTIVDLASGESVYLTDEIQDVCSSLRVGDRNYVVFTSVSMCSPFQDL